MLELDPVSESEMSPIDSTIANAQFIVPPRTTPPLNDQLSKNVLSLLKLPRELRDLIYHELWHMTAHLKFQTPFRLLYRPHDHDCSCRFHCPARTTQACIYPKSVLGLPLWLLTSKVILSEGLEQLFRYADWLWSFDDPSAPPGYSKTNPLAGLSRATNLRIHDTYQAHKKNGSKASGKIVIDYSKHSLRKFDHTLPQHIKTLRLNLSIKTPSAPPIDLNLSELKPKSLRVEHLALTFKLNLWTEPTGTCEGRYSTFLHYAKREVSRVGKIWLCEDEETELEMTMETQMLGDDIMPRGRGESDVKLQMYVIRFEVAQKGTLKRVSRSAERLIL